MAESVVAGCCEGVCYDVVAYGAFGQGVGGGVGRLILMGVAGEGEEEL